MKVDVNIDACKQGEREALGNLYKAYSDRLKRICLHYVTDESTAEDILHDAFIIIFTSIKSLKDNSKLRSEEHTSELQSRQYLVCRLLLEKKKNIHPTLQISTTTTLNNQS